MAIYLLAPILQVFVFTWDAQALSSESHMKTQPLRTFGNTITLLWFQIYSAKV